MRTLILLLMSSVSALPAKPSSVVGVHATRRTFAGPSIQEVLLLHLKGGATAADDDSPSPSSAKAANEAKILKI